MKRLLCVFLMIFFCLNLSASANDTLSKLENGLFGIDYNGQNDYERLTRLEKTVYGKNFKDSNLIRTKRLYDDLCGDEIGHEITPKFDTFAEEDDLIAMQEKVNYPVLDELEENVFKKKFPNKDLNERLASLEKFSFNKTYDKENFADRVERLRKDILGTRMDDMNYYEKNFEQYNDYNQPNSLVNSFDNSDYNFSSKESGHNDIAKDEMYYFNRTFDNESLAKRKKRIKSIKKAQNYSAGYDDNKFQQKFSTAMQIGAMLLMILAIVL